MLKPKKRLSAGMGLSADGIDPPFEFDVPRVFKDLTLPPRYAHATHDPWFDLVHEHHSRPTEEFLAAQQPEPSRPHSDSAPPLAATHRALYYHPPHHDADGEKENAGGSGGPARLKRRNVAASYGATAQDAAPVGTLKATMRTVSVASAAKTGASAPTGGAVKKPTKLPFGNSTGSSSSTPAAGVTPAGKQGAAASGANVMPRKRPVAERATEASKARSRALPASQRRTTGAAVDKDLHDLQALLAKHNKKFKTNHTYEPRQHSVRDVRQWERQTQKSYYKLTLEDRFQANIEIAQLVRDREDAAAAR